MPRVWCVRANFGKFADYFVKHGFIGLNYGITEDLTKLQTKEQITKAYKTKHPEEKSPIVIGQQVGQFARFLLEIQPNDFVITPSEETEWLYWGKVLDEPTYFVNDDSYCPALQRRKVSWNKDKLRRWDLSIPLQNTLQSSLTIFEISQQSEFFERVGLLELAPPKTQLPYDPYKVVLERILELDDKEFEILVGHLLGALGFEETEVVGKTGDGGVDVKGVLNSYNLAKIQIFVQAKRYKLGQRISANTVKALRSTIPIHAQGAFITTADFPSSAKNIANEAGFPRIGLINGNQLVDLLVEHWDDIPLEFQTSLKLKPGLVLS